MPGTLGCKQDGGLLQAIKPAATRKLDIKHPKFHRKQKAWIFYPMS